MLSAKERNACCEAREWNPNMPVPAGAGIDRRRFLAGAAGGLMTVYGAGRLGITSRVLGDGIAEAAAGTPGQVLVSVFIAGGIDALSVLAPVGDPLYHRYRPTLAVPENQGTPFAEDPRLHWHPAASSFAALHGAGKMTVFPGIGYTSPDMSHFTSRHYWEVGATSTELNTGWLGRYLDAHGTTTNPLQGLSMDGEMNPTLASARNPVAAIDRPDDFSLWLNGVWGNIFDYTLDSASALGGHQRGSRDPAIAQVAEAASEVGVVRHALAPFRNASGNPSYTSPVTYPTVAQGDFPKRLAGLAAMIAAGLPLKCVAMTTDTQVDTHSAQPGTFVPALQIVADSLAAFQSDLEARGIADRVLVHVWSEFGRRAQQNSSNGTDHGAAGVSMVIGTRASGNMVGVWPELTRLDVNGNQIANVDYRAVYCSLIEQWFGDDPSAVIPNARSFVRPQLIR